MRESETFKATLTRTLNQKKVHVLERDVLVIRDDGSWGVVKAGTEFPAYDAHLEINPVTTPSSLDRVKGEGR